MRAARRGVECRVMVDGAGSRRLLRSPLWEEMAAAGVLTAEALPVSPIRAIFERVDMRNHRKIAVIDGCVAYCGSHNVTNENFTTRKASNLAPYLDATVRLRGPAVHALQCVFFRDWLLDGGTTQLPDMRTMLSEIEAGGQSTVQVVPSGPAPYDESLQHALLAMMYGARQRLSVTTPYFVPDEATKSALVNAALRGVDVTLIIPMWSDSKLVSAAGRSHFDELLEAGVRIRRHRYGLLHAKSAVADDALSVIGSANFDMRSFSLNFEVTLIVADPDFASRLLALHASYLERSEPVEAASWRQRPLAERFVDNLAQLAGPLL
jgi:cardiolipin synthase